MKSIITKIFLVIVLIVALGGAGFLLNTLVEMNATVARIDRQLKQVITVVNTANNNIENTNIKLDKVKDGLDRTNENVEKMIKTLKGSWFF